MKSEMSQEEVLNHVLDRVAQRNLSGNPGTPVAELRAAIEGALSALPPLEFEEFEQVLDNTDAASKLVERAPEIVGWNADQIVEWVEEIAKKLGMPAR